MNDLERQIRNHQQAYDAGAPTLSDAEFDVLVERLRQEDPASPVLEELGSAGRAAPVEHARPMLSLEKVYSVADLLAWAKRAPCSHYTAQPKLDGISCALRYDSEGRLAVAATRGDGTVGENIMHNVRRLSSVPQRIKMRNVEVRGELVMPKSLFAEKWSSEYANTRNMVAGLMLRHDAVPATQDVVFVAYDLYEKGVRAAEPQADALRSSGFTTAPFRAYSGGDGNLQELVDDLFRICDEELDFDTDGVVVKIYDPKLYEELGATAHHPRGAVAFKRAAEARTTTLRNVIWQTARTGRISPVAEVDPVELSGASVSRATLHNLSNFRTLAPHVGDRVSMTRRGGVIPQVEAVEHIEPAGAPLLPPARCPGCGALTVIDGEYLFCKERDDCPEAVVGQIEHWCKTVGMLGFGPEVVNELYEKGAVQNVGDIYRMDIDQMGWGRMSTKLLSEVARTRRMPLETFIQALGIGSIGRTVAGRVAAELGSVDALVRWALDPASPALSAVGQAAQIELRAWMRRNGRIALVLSLAASVEIEAQDVAEVVEGSPLVAQKVVFTGELAGWAREDAQKLVRRLGGLTPDGLTRDTDILVIGSLAKEAQRGKRDKAERYNAKGASIRILDEGAFLDMIKDFR